MSLATADSSDTTSRLQAAAIDARLKASHAMDKLAAEVQPHAIIEKTINEFAELATDKISQAQSSVSTTLLRSVKRNAWPAIAIGVGVIYLLSKYNSSQHKRNTEPDTKHV